MIVGRSIYWFRNDLRLLDNPQFLKACEHSDALLPVFIVPEHTQTRWGFERCSAKRIAFINDCVHDLARQLHERGSSLLVVQGDPVQKLSELVHQHAITTIYCETIAALEEQAVLQTLTSLGIAVDAAWQSSMLDPKTLGFAMTDLPDVFTTFRKEVERRKLKYTLPLSVPASIPPSPLPSIPAMLEVDSDPLFIRGGEQYGLLHLKNYFAQRLADTYKQTRNQLSGFNTSSKFSPWLATGSLSARTIMAHLDAYEQQFGANDGTYWLWFELLWRDYFRFLSLKYGKRLFHGKGLSHKSPFIYDPLRFEQWRTGTTGVDLIDAGMRELQATGFLSNRMRQIVASYWIYSMSGNWQVGAAWFETCLLDYDVYSNQGNWLYVAGHGTDPRGGRAFNVQKQILEYDPEGSYRQQWLP